MTESYAEIIEKQKSEGIVEVASDPPKGKEFYIPHKPVIRMGAETTKLRIVYDASSRANPQVPCLNDWLYAGPPLQNHLWSVLVRMRFHPVLITGDLQQAFLQVRIKKEERDALRFHWKTSEHSEVEVLRFTRALYGPSQWTRWKKELPAEVMVARALTCAQEQIEEIELHAFGDASKNGVCATVHAVVRQPLGVSQGWVTARARLAKQGLTISRLELVSAHMAANLITK